MKVLFVIALACFTSACASADQLTAITEHLKERNCKTSGRIDLHPASISPVTGWAVWECPDPKAE